MVLGLNDMLLPRLNNLSFLIVPLALSMFCLALIIKGGGVGWTMYPPLVLGVYSPTFSIDLIILSLHVAGISSLFGSINIIVTRIVGGKVSGSVEQTPLIV